MTYYKHHNILDALHCECVDAPSGDSADGMTCDTHHRHMDDLHHVCVDSADSGKKVVIMINIKGKAKFDKNVLEVSIISIQNHTLYHSVLACLMLWCAVNADIMCTSRNLPQCGTTFICIIYISITKHTYSQS
jgi:hypothetical protein